jgi:hypothetical protein
MSVRQPAHSSFLCPCHEGVDDVVQPCVGVLKWIYWRWAWENSPTLVLVLVLFFEQVRTKDGLYWFENHRAFIQKHIFFFHHHVIYSSRVRSTLHSIDKGGYTYLEPLGGHMYLICMLCNMNPYLYLPSHLKLAQCMTHPGEFDVFLYGLAHIYATKIYESITLWFINQNSTPCLVLTEEGNFNPSTMLN